MRQLNPLPAAAPKLLAKVTSRHPLARKCLISFITCQLIGSLLISLAAPDPLAHPLELL